MVKMVGIRIKDKRKELHLTQTQIQSQTGISTGNLSEIERGIKLPSLSTLVKIAEALNCSTDYLLYGKVSLSQAEKGAFQDTLSEVERELINKFKQLEPRDQDDILTFINIKFDKHRKGKTSSDSHTANITESA